MKKKKKIGIIDCDFGNIASLINSLKFLNLDFKVIETKIDTNDITHLILPGVGSFNKAAKKLKKSGLDHEIKEFTLKSKPFLGICLGMQLMFNSGTENGKEYGLGLFQGECNKFSNKLEVSLPHIGFNLVENNKTKIWKGIPSPSPFYFVHSYRVSPQEKNLDQVKLSKTFYGEDFISFIEQDNIFGAQFHPEKSHKAGLNLLKNFAEEF
jgi:imidazole glycerol-phosphate synthase subunit HisH